MKKILLVDDDEQLRSSFYNLLVAEGYTVLVASSGETALKILENDRPDVVIMDVRMPGMDGVTTLKHMHEKEPRLPVIIMTAYSTTESAIEATKCGAFDYILKPFDIPDVLELLNKAVEASRIMQCRIVFDDEIQASQTELLVGKSKIMHQLYKGIGKVAQTDALVLIRGESGTGKDLVARAIYQHSSRNNKPFSIINCVAIPETLLESELFGYERGAFTGANTKRIGKIEQANGGTLFLDEIGDMPVSIQAKLLRLLEEKQIERLGGRELINVDVRIVAATNRNLEEAVSSGQFREDLFYRLNVVSLYIPPLRERPEDIPLLCKHLMTMISLEMEVATPEISPGALSLLLQHPWPGNVRELRNVLQRILIFNFGAPVSVAEVEKAFEVRTDEVDRELLPTEAGLMLKPYINQFLRANVGGNVYDLLVDKMGGLVIQEALSLCEGNRSRTAKMLGFSRPTLLAKIDKYGVGKE